MLLLKPTPMLHDLCMTSIALVVGSPDCTQYHVIGTISKEHVLQKIQLVLLWICTILRSQYNKIISAEFYLNLVHVVNKS